MQYSSNLTHPKCDIDKYLYRYATRYCTRIIFHNDTAKMCQGSYSYGIATSLSQSTTLMKTIILVCKVTKATRLTCGIQWSWKMQISWTRVSIYVRIFRGWISSIQTPPAREWGRKRAFRHAWIGWSYSWVDTWNARATPFFLATRWMVRWQAFERNR